MQEPRTENPSGGGHPVGESQNQPFQLSFNRFLRVAFQGSRVTSDGGLILVRELREGKSVSAARLVDAGKEARSVLGTAKTSRAGPQARHGDLGLTQEGDWRTVWCKVEAEIGNSGPMSSLKDAVEKSVTELYKRDQEFQPILSFANSVCEWYATGGSPAVEDGLKRNAREISKDFEQSFELAKKLISQA